MKKSIFILVLLLCLVTSCEKEQKYTITFDFGYKTITEEFNANDSVKFPTTDNEFASVEYWTVNGEKIESYVANSNATLKAVYNETKVIEFVKQYIQNSINEDTKEGVFVKINLPTEYKGALITWKSTNEKVINSTTGLVNRLEYTTVCTLTANISYNGISENVKYKITVQKLDPIVVLTSVMDAYTFDSEVINGKVNLKTDFATLNSPIECVWESLNERFINSYGEIVLYSDVEEEVELKLSLILDGETLSKTFTVVIPALTSEELLALAIKKANIETFVTSDKAYLPTEFEYEYVGTWTSSNPSVLGHDGTVYLTENHETVNMELKLQKIGSEEFTIMNYEFDVHVRSVLPIAHANEFNVNNMVNCEIENNRLVLSNGQVEGSYESDVIETIDYEVAVASWAAISSKNATVELLVKVRVNGVWSEYISYCPGGWGLGLQNKCYDKSLSTVKLVTDELKIQNNQSADAVMFKVILRRTTANYESPKLSLVAFALTSNSYVGPTYSLEDLPSYVKHDVVKLNQNKVPSIGNIICSATSSTMLLKYKGMDFFEFDSEYEHRYIAGLVKDYGNNIYGNWVYNTVGMSAFGFNSYVARLYSVAELCHHLATIGPVACSMKGQMTSDQKDYYTAGHLICIIGYTYENGKLTLISNDPNVPSVECLYSEEVFTNTWRNIIYVIE